MLWNADNPVDMDAWVDAFIRLQTRGSRDAEDPDWWAFERTLALVLRQDAGEDMWTFILAVLAKRPPDAVIASLAAGPLEDLIARQGKCFIDRIELAARQDPAFRELLGGVWKNRTPDDIWARVELARRGKYW